MTSLQSRFGRGVLSAPAALLVAAYKLTEKTVLRGGFGIFMSPFQIETPNQLGFSGSTPFVPTNDNRRTFIATLSNPFPSGLLPSPGASQGLLSNVGLGLDGPPLPVDRRNAKFARLIFGVQRELPGQFVVEANYVTACGYDLAGARNLNFVPRSFLGDTPATDTLEDRISPDERPHRYTLSAVYQLPFGRGRKFGGAMNRVLDALAGGWQFNGAYEWQKGEPFVFGNPLYFAGDVTRLESRVGPKDEQGRTYGIDISAFDPGLVRLSAFGYRNVPTTLDNLRNQSFMNVNLSVTKNFNFGEGRRLQFRVESLNAFIRPYFGAGINLDPNNQAFGFVTTQRNNPRDIQLGAKFTF
jgi:hypothetical protein